MFPLWKDNENIQKCNWWAHILSVLDVRTVCLIKSLCLNHFKLLIKSPIFEDLRSGKGL